MPIMQSGINAVSGHLPKVISPNAHAIADYAVAGGFGVVAALMWNRNRRAAVASLACAAGAVTNALISDSPGGVAKLISHETHNRIDIALAAASSALPGFLRFTDEPESKFFRTMGLAITVIGAMTELEPKWRRRGSLRRIA